MKENEVQEQEKEVKRKSVLLVEGCPLFHWIAVGDILGVSEVQILEYFNCNKGICLHCVTIGHEDYIDLEGLMLLAMKVNTEPGVLFRKWAAEKLKTLLLSYWEGLAEIDGPMARIKQLCTVGPVQG